MKLVIGIVRPEKTNDVLEALYRAQVRGITLSRVQGHGGELDRVETYRGTTVKVGVAEKVRFEIAVSDDFVDTTVKALCDGARTGQVGDDWRAEMWGAIVAMCRRYPTMLGGLSEHWWRDRRLVKWLSALATWRINIDAAAEDPREEISFHNALQQLARIVEQAPGRVGRFEPDSSRSYRVGPLSDLAMRR